LKKIKYLFHGVFNKKTSKKMKKKKNNFCGIFLKAEAAVKTKRLRISPYKRFILCALRGLS